MQNFPPPPSDPKKKQEQTTESPNYYFLNLVNSTNNNSNKQSNIDVKKIHKDEFYRKVASFSTISLEDISNDISQLSRDQKMDLRKNILKRLTVESSTLDDDDMNIVKRFFTKSFIMTFAGVGMHKLAKNKELLGRFGIHPQRFFIGRILAFKYGIGVFAPIMLLMFKDFVHMTLAIGLKYQYVCENMKNVVE